ncbi:MAG: tape measure protein [Peptococcaceae bacterium]|nr:tape measure protein [Peptococcaceae bacterium]
MADKVIIEVVARFIDNVTSKTKKADESVEKLGKTAKKTQEQLDKLGKGTRKVIIDGSADKLLKKLDTLDKKVKSLTKGKISLRLGADDKATAVLLKVTNAAKSFANKTYRGLITLRDANATNTIRSLKNSAESLTRRTWQTVVSVKDMATAPLTKIKNMLFSIKSLVLAVTAGLAAQQFVAKPIALADAYSSARIGFSTLLGESQGQQMMDDLDVFAQETPFNTSEVIANTQKMIAMGWDASSIIDDMTVIGDAAAATGKGNEGLSRIVLALAQIKSKGKLSTEELNQLAEAGISAKRYLAEGLGYGSGDEGIAKLASDLEKGAIMSDEAITAIMKGMEEYKGMMTRTANETVEGLKSQIADAFEISIFRRWGQGLQDGAKRGLGSVVELLDTAQDGLNRVGDLLYDIGSQISTTLADKFENAVNRINEITDTFEFQNASLGEKIKMLWKGVITDPLGEWWEENQAAFADKAEALGAKMGSLLSKAIKGLLGMTDVFDGSGLDEDGAASIAQRFAQGFVENFDVSGIGQKIIESIADVWGALPTWAKILVGGYGAAKLVSGLGSLAGGVLSAGSAARGLIGSTGNAMVSGSGALGTLASAGYAMAGGAATSTLSGGAAAATGLSGIFGGGVAVKGLYEMYRALTAEDKTDRQVYAAKGGVSLAGVGTGALVGTAIAPGVGTAIGAGIGGLVGLVGGGQLAKAIRAAKVESEDLKATLKDSSASADDIADAFDKAVFENAKKNLGDIKLTTAEIQRLANQIVWGDALEGFDKFKQAQQQVEAAVQSLNSYGQATDKWLWKASLGVKFNADEVASIVESFEGYVTEAKNVLESKHYEFTAAVSMLVDVEGAEGKRILESGNAIFTQLQEQLDSLGTELTAKVKVALEDGVIDMDEGAEIAALQQQIAEILEKVANAEYSANIELTKLKFGEGTLDYESFNAFLSQMQTTIDERMAAADEAFTVAVSALNLRLSEDASYSDAQFKSDLSALQDSYRTTIDELRADVMRVELDLLAGSNYGVQLGEAGLANLQAGLEQALADGIDPISWSADEVERILGVHNLSAETYAALGRFMSQMYAQLSSLNISGAVKDALPKDVAAEINITPEPKINQDTVSLASAVGVQLKGLMLTEPVETTKDVSVTAKTSIANAASVPADVSAKAQAAIPDAVSGKTTMNVSADTKCKKVSIVAKDFGLKDSYKHNVIWNITGNKRVSKISLTANDFGLPSAIQHAVNIQVKSNVTTSGSSSKSFRGGLYGADIPGYSDGGMVRGGARLVTVAEEGTPEMIIPLSSQRRERGRKLWAKAGQMLEVPGFARGGHAQGGEDEGIRFAPQRETGGPQPQGTTIEVGGVHVSFQVHAEGGQDVAEVIEARGSEIAETVAGFLADALEAQFINTPTLGGA